MLRIWLLQFAHDTKVHIALLLVLADLVFGVAAALKLGTFRMSYIADFAKNDILFKLLPYFGLYAMALVAGNNDIVIPGLDFGLVAGAMYVALVAAWTGSILSSLVALGVPIPLPKEVTGPEKVPVTPVVAAVPRP